MRSNTITIGDRLRAPRGAEVTVVALTPDDQPDSVQLLYPSGTKRWIWYTDALKLEQLP